MDFPGQSVELLRGQVLWNEGDASDFVVFIEEGNLEVVRYSADGECAILNVLKPGEWLGEMSCLDGQPHSATVRSRAGGRIRRVLKSEFVQWVHGDPQRWQALLHKQSERLRRLTGRFVENSLESVRRRLVRRLLESGTSEIAVTHQELAEELGTTRESVSKALGELSRAGLVKGRRGKIEILNRAALSLE